MEPNTGRIEEYRALRAEIGANDRLMQTMSLCMGFAMLAWAVGYVAFGTTSIQTRASGAAALLGDMAGLDELSKAAVPLVLAPALLACAYFQMVLHKLEGTLRIAAYLRVMIEPRVPGLAWETRLAGPASPYHGLNGPHVYFLALGLGASLWSGLLSFRDRPEFAVVMVPLFLCLAYGFWRIYSFRTATIGPDGFEAQFRRIAAREQDQA